MQHGFGRMCLGLAVAAGLSAAVVGCSSHHTNQASVERREKAVNTVSDLRTDLKRADDQVAATQQSLHRLAGQQAGDLKPSYDAFTSDISRDRSVNEKLASRSMDLANEASKHVNAWDAQARTIQSDALRQQSLQREQQARQEQTQTLNDVNDLRGMYTQYIRQMEDISTYAANDLTPHGVAGLHDQVQKADQIAQDLRNRMAQVDARLGRLAESWRTDTPLAARVSGNESAQPAGGQMNTPGNPQQNTQPNQQPGNTSGQGGSGI